MVKPRLRGLNNLNRVTEPPKPVSIERQISKHWIKFQVEPTMLESRLKFEKQRRPYSKLPDSIPRTGDTRGQVQVWALYTGGSSPIQDKKKTPSGRTTDEDLYPHLKKS